MAPDRDPRQLLEVARREVERLRHVVGRAEGDQGELGEPFETGRRDPVDDEVHGPVTPDREDTGERARAELPADRLERVLVVGARLDEGEGTLALEDRTEPRPAPPRLEVVRGGVHHDEEPHGSILTLPPPTSGRLRGSGARTWAPRGTGS